MSSAPASRRPASQDGGATSSEGEGEDLRPGAAYAGDSSEEESSNSEEERELRAGFIDDEGAPGAAMDLDSASGASGGSGGEEEGKKRKKRRRHRKRKKESRKRRHESGSDDEELDLDDLALVAENTGQVVPGAASGGGGAERKRLRRGGRASSHASQASQGSDGEDDLERMFADEDDDDRPSSRPSGAAAKKSTTSGAGAGAGKERGGPAFPFMEDEMADFIEDSEDSASAASGDEEDSDEDLPDLADPSRRRRSRPSKKKGRRRGEKGRGRGRGIVYGGALAEMDPEMRQEIVDVFGNGEEYFSSLEEEEGEGEQGEKGFEQLFEHSVLASRLMSKEDDYIRDLDLPERLQLSSVGLNPPVLGPDGVEGFLTEGEVEDMTEWACPRISVRCSKLFLSSTEEEEEGEGEGGGEKEKFTKAVRNVIKFLNIDFLEPPFIWAQRSDYLLHEDAGLAYLTKEEIWKLSTMSGKFRAVVQRGKEVKGWWKEVRAASEEAALAAAAAAAGGGGGTTTGQEEEEEGKDKEQKEGEITSDDIDYFDDFALEMDAVEDVADLRAWLDVAFPLSTTSVREARRQAEVQAAEEAGAPPPPARRKMGTETRYAVARSTQVREMAGKVGIKARELGQAFGEGEATASVEVVDPEETPAEMAEKYVREDEYRSVPAVLEAVKVLCSHEIAADPKVRKRTRNYFKSYAEVSVHPTEKGRREIQEDREDFGFKYLERKPVGALVGYNPKDREHQEGGGAQFLRILAAEEAGEVKVDISLPRGALMGLLKALKDPYCGLEQGEWRDFREEIVEMAVEETLLPMGAAWAREYIREELVEAVGVACGDALSKQADQMPFYRQDDTMVEGEVPTVLALSHGNGDPQRDSVRAVFLDVSGMVREVAKFDNLREEEHRETFAELLKNRKPQAIVLGGWKANTAQLMKDVMHVANAVTSELLNSREEEEEDEDDYGGRRRDGQEALTSEQKTAQATFQCFFVEDKVARLYMNSDRAKAEYEELDTLGRYCVALARFAQSPLNEFAAMGKDLVSIPFDPNQKFLPNAVLLQYLERAIVDLVNKVGVDVNRATRDPYYYHLLPFVCGLGPRKANAVRIKIHGPDVGGSLLSRDQLITKSLVSRNVWINCAGFLRIPQEEDAGDLRDEEEGGALSDPLDSMRVHPEDYSVARKMAADALELDEEDVAGMAHPSDPVKMLLKDDRSKLDELSLEEFAQELFRLTNDPKRFALYNIRTEMKKPFYEQRDPFTFPNSIDLFYQLSGEMPQFLRPGLIIPCKVVRITRDERIITRLESGLEGEIDNGQRGDQEDEHRVQKPRVGEPIDALVTDLIWDEFKVKLSTLSRGLADGDGQVRHTPRDRYWSTEREEADRKAVEDAQRKGKTQQRRQINHPNFENVTASEAENKLRNGQRGDCIVRPSSKEDHLAVTWKVDDDVFQHIAVLEVEKPDEHGMGRVLRIGRDFSYEDLDDLIANHIRALARKVDELSNHEKYKGTKEQLDSSLIASTMADPGKSYYGFAINKEKTKGGTFLLGFKTDQNASIEYWTVTLQPRAFVLREGAHADMLQLCNAFKTLYSNAMKPAPAGGALGSRSVRAGASGMYSVNPAARKAYTLAGGATPRPGGMTPGQRPLGGATPAYGGASGYGGAAYGGASAYGGARSNLTRPVGMGGATPGYGQQVQQAQQGGRTPGYQGQGGRTPGYQQNQQQQQRPQQQQGQTSNW